MRNRRQTRTPSQNEPYEPQEAPVAPAPVEEPVVAPEPAPVAVEDTEEAWVNPLILAARRGEQVEFGEDIVPVEGNEPPAPADTEE